MVGREVTPEARINMSKAALGKVLTEETKTKMGLARVNRKRIIDNNGAIYECISDASRALGINNSNIVKVLKGKYKQTNGYTFKYI